MIYEAHDMKTETKNYYSDKAQQTVDREYERNEIARREWAQRNGNDSGFDPYAYCEYED